MRLSFRRAPPAQSLLSLSISLSKVGGLAQFISASRDFARKNTAHAWGRTGHTARHLHGRTTHTHGRTTHTECAVRPCEGFSRIGRSSREHLHVLPVSDKGGGRWPVRACVRADKLPKPPNLKTPKSGDGPRVTKELRYDKPPACTRALKGLIAVSRLE